MEPETLNMTLDEWKAMFLPPTIGPDMQPRLSQCTMYNITDNATLSRFLSGELPGEAAAEYPQASCEELAAAEHIEVGGEPAEKGQDTARDTGEEQEWPSTPPVGDPCSIPLRASRTSVIAA